MIPAAGALSITLLPEADGRVGTALRAPPPLPVARMLCGRTPEEAARLVPLVWNVCAAAQEAAARSALGLAPAPGAADRIRAEILREHAAKLCQVWPVLAGTAPAPGAALLAARAARDGAAAADLAAALFAPLRRAPADWAELARWMAAGETAPARAFAAVDGTLDPAWGRAALPLLDLGQPVDWAAATQAGRPVENGPVCRLRGSALLADIAARRGPGLLWRMAARLVELGALLAGEGPALPEARGIAPAARGAMMVDATVAEGRVVALQRLAPTDFALARGGLLAAALGSLPALPAGRLASLARLVVSVVDPCVGVEIAVREPAHA